MPGTGSGEKVSVACGVILNHLACHSQKSTFSPLLYLGLQPVG